MDSRLQAHVTYQFDPSSFRAKQEFKQRRKGHGR